MAAEQERTFDFTISCAGEDCAVAEELAGRLCHLGFRVFYYGREQVYLLGKDMRRELGWTFGRGTAFFVPLISKHFVEKEWPRHEWSIACQEAKRRHQEFILPLRLDDTLFPGLVDSVWYIDLRRRTVAQAANLLAEKHASLAACVSVPYRLVATFGLVVDELVKRDALPEGVSRQYPLLCDWLEEDLLSRLSRAPISNVQKTEASSRDGECLSVRVSFEWDPHSGPLNFGALHWWETLEVAPFEDIYPSE